MTSLWRHLWPNYDTMNFKILTQCVKMLGERVLQVWRWYLHRFRRYRKKTRGGLEIAPPPVGRGLKHIFCTYLYEWRPPFIPFSWPYLPIVKKTVPPSAQINHNHNQFGFNPRPHLGGGECQQESASHSYISHRYHRHRQLVVRFQGSGARTKILTDKVATRVTW